jgi:hypothetical protein
MNVSRLTRHGELHAAVHSTNMAVFLGRIPELKVVAVAFGGGALSRSALLPGSRLLMRCKLRQQFLETHIVAERIPIGI